MKAKARALLIEIPDYALGTSELWTPPLVKAALVDAYRMIRRVGGRVGPAHIKAAWPEYRLDQADFAEQVLAGTLKHLREPRSPYRTAMTVTRMEHILLGWKDDEGREHPAWMAGPLLDLPREREKLLQWVDAEIRGEAFTALCERRHWPLATAKRHRDTAAGLIAHRLNAAQVEVW